MVLASHFDWSYAELRKISIRLGNVGVQDQDCLQFESYEFQVYRTLLWLVHGKMGSTALRVGIHSVCIICVCTAVKKVIYI